jgi:quercetin dioxygenase-like cupin family protein
MDKDANTEKNVIGQILNPSEMIAYQKASIVSRTIVNKKVGTVTLFAFDKGQSLSEHTAPFDAIIQIVDGKGEVLIGGKPHQLGKGQMIIMPANIPHAVTATAKFKMLLVMIRS